jgi:hypothetical protein
MITNYKGLYDNIVMPLQLILPKAVAAADWVTVYNVTKWVITTKKIAISDADYNRAALNWERAAMKLGGAYLAEFNAAGIVVVDTSI